MSLAIPHPTTPAAPAPDNGVFLVGAERSGTTMLRLMLDHHPRVAWLNEFEYAVDMVGDDGAPPADEDYRRFLGTHRVFRASRLCAEPGLSYADQVRGFLRQRRDAAGKPFVGATVHRHFERLLFFWPHARFIHLVRDPRDVAPSVIRMGWAGNAYTACERWIEAEKSWDRVAARVDPARRIELRFEDLLADPRDALLPVCALIGVPFHDSMLSFHEDTTYEPPDPAAGSRWKSRVSACDLGLIEGRVGGLMNARGYQASGNPPTHPGPGRLAFLRLQNRVARIRWRIDRYGLGLYAAGRAARFVSRRKAWPRIMRRMQEIDRGHLQ